jgi:hypothetical protein
LNGYGWIVTAWGIFWVAIVASFSAFLIDYYTWLDSNEYEEFMKRLAESK